MTAWTESCHNPLEISSTLMVSIHLPHAVVVLDAAPHVFRSNRLCNGVKIFVAFIHGLLKRAFSFVVHVMLLEVSSDFGKIEP